MSTTEGSSLFVSLDYVRARNVTAAFHAHFMSKHATTQTAVQGTQKKRSLSEQRTSRT